MKEDYSSSKMDVSRLFTYGKYFERKRNYSYPTTEDNIVFSGQSLLPRYYLIKYSRWWERLRVEVYRAYK